MLTYPYSWIINARNRRFDRGQNVKRVNGFVISVGNLTTGGTGKTPLVCYLAKKLRELDLRVVLLSRGYGAGQQGVNDEALELESRLPDVPHLQDPDRCKIAEIAIEELASEVLILDDGFQHRKLYRDVDLLVVDATNPFGYGYLLPRGLLRESLQSITRADFVILNRCNAVGKKEVTRIKEKIREVQPEIPIAEAETVPSGLIDYRGNQSPTECVEKKKVLAFCGIGNPLGFTKTLADLNVDLIELKEFPDHHRYSREDIQELSTWVEAARDCDWVLCTHKDLVKINLGQMAGKPLFAVMISNKIRLRERKLWQTINEKMQQPPA